MFPRFYNGLASLIEISDQGDHPDAGHNTGGAGICGCRAPKLLGAPEAPSERDQAAPNSSRGRLPRDRKG